MSAHHCNAPGWFQGLHLRRYPACTTIFVIILLAIAGLPAEADEPTEQHWAFVPPHPAAPPEVVLHQWPSNPIDRFVLARLEQSGLQPSPRASRETLIRRLSLDLTGLPPTPQQVESFVRSRSPRAWQELVDRLLSSPRYGERMAVEWLDAARYADTHGYLFDTERSMWRWRDWVIESFNRNQPFDQFSIEQLAGDLLPSPTPQQLIATGFNRNHIINNEAGATPEEYYVENIIDRVNTTATVWMGLSLACAQCHDHKHDPFTTREYYQLYAFFNNVPEVGLDGFNANAKPLMTAPTRNQQSQMARLESRLASAEQEFEPLAGKFAPAQANWEREFKQPIDPLDDGMIVHLTCDGTSEDAVSEELHGEFKDGSEEYAEGLFSKAVALDGQRFVELGDRGDFGICDQFSLSAWVYQTDTAGRRSIFSRMAPPELGFRGYTLQMIGGAPALFLVSQFPEDLLQVQAKRAIEPHQWHHILVTYDGSSSVAGVKLYVDGELQETSITIDNLENSFQTEKPLQIGNGYPGAKFVGRIDEVRIYDRVLEEDQIPRLAGLSIHSLLAVKTDDRTEEQNRRIGKYYLEHAAPEKWRQPYDRLIALREDKKRLERAMPTVMVMEELQKPRETKILVRGEYSRPGTAVSAATPAVLPPLKENAAQNRLGLARWLVDPQHPLTARVAVNRFWQMYFGTGLVETTEDFGRLGATPSHPQLLDWLATEFIRSGWDVKALQRLIVTSATYQQSSRVSSELLEIDPQNRLLARGPRHRLQAEFLRDQALAVSGLLVEQQGGPSVKPYQPEGLWREVAFDVTGKALTAQVYQADSGSALYRRGMYTFWKRTAPPPTMLIFDAPDRERCVVRRQRTSTPLQALVLMNDPTYVEAARNLAERMMRGAGTDASRISRGFQLVTGRTPSARELAPLLKLFQQQQQRFANDKQGADGLLSVGQSPRDESLAASPLAAYTVVASVLLNLDEVMTKG